ncbi:MAG: DUF4129 domain-containing protein [Isosphaeraceae bacterium]
MVIAFAWTLMMVTSTPGPNPGVEVRSALSKGNYPWYDAKADAVKTVKPPPSSNKPKPGKPNLPTMADTIVFIIMVVGLAIIVLLLAWAWARYRPDPETLLLKSRSVGLEQRTTTLPTGLQVDLTDPLGEARRLRDLGDLAGAITCLFVHQLLTLDRLGQIRLAPGKTARQLVRSVSDPLARRWVEPTSRLFEAVYYGHIVPTIAAFDAAWADAEALEHWASAGVKP